MAPKGVRKPAILSFNGSKPARGVQQQFTVVSLRPGQLCRPGDVVQDHAQFRFGRQRKLDHDKLPRQFRRQGQATAQDDQHLALGFSVAQRLLELPQQDGIAVLNELMEVFEQDHRVLRQVADGFNGLQWIIGLFDLSILRVDQSLRHRPGEQRILHRCGYGFHLRLDPRFFARHEADAGISRPDVVCDLISHTEAPFDLMVLMVCALARADSQKSNWPRDSPALARR